MCINPTYIYLHGAPTVQTIHTPGPVAQSTEYEKQAIACGRCWACLKNKQNDLIGRCMAEASTSQWVHTLTLTYDDKLASPAQVQQINKSDFQNFMKRFRKQYSARYLVAGEYGSKKGRAHFHAILFGTGPEPAASHLSQKTYYPHWDWGYVWSDPTISPKAIKYVAKYLTKGRKRRGDDRFAQEWVSYSKVPLLGGEFFRRLGFAQGERQTPPYNLNYMPPDYDGGAKFSMYGRAQDEYFAALLTVWPEFATAKKTDWVENAYRRYTNRLHLQNWEALPICQRDQIITEQFRSLTQEDLTNGEKSQIQERQANQSALRALPSYWAWRDEMDALNYQQRMEKGKQHGNP